MPPVEKYLQWRWRIGFLGAGTTTGAVRLEVVVSGPDSEESESLPLVYEEEESLAGLPVAAAMSASIPSSLSPVSNFTRGAAVLSSASSSPESPASRLRLVPALRASLTFCSARSSWRRSFSALRCCLSILVSGSLLALAASSMSLSCLALALSRADCSAAAARRAASSASFSWRRALVGHFLRRSSSQAARSEGSLWIC